MTASRWNLGVFVVLVAVAVANVAWWQYSQRDGGRGRQLNRFYDAIVRGDETALGQYLDAEPKLVNVLFGNMESPLHSAARLNRPGVIRLFHDRGADMTMRGQWDGTALHWAAWWGSSDAVKVLLDFGSGIEDKGDIYRSSPLLWAAHGSGNNSESRGDYSATVNLLIARGAQADTYNGEGVPAVLMASQEVADILVAHGAKRPTTRPSYSGQMASRTLAGVRGHG